MSPIVRGLLVAVAMIAVTLLLIALVAAAFEDRAEASSDAYAPPVECGSYTDTGGQSLGLLMVTQGEEAT